MGHTVVFDCEFLVSEGAPGRHWCGPHDPDPLVVQIGAAKLDLAAPFEIVDTLGTVIRPVDRHGAPCPIDPAFAALTGLDEATIAATGVPLAEAVRQLAAFADGSMLWSWGKDELNLMAISCYVAGLAPPVPADRFGNACRLLLRAGMAYEDIKTTRSHSLPGRFGLETPSPRAHDARDDARGVAMVLQHLLRAGRLAPADFGSGA